MSEPMDDATRCTATSKQSGERCKRRPIRGGSVCAMHGGKTPAVVAKAEQRLQARQALLAAEAFGLPREVDPHSALLEELHRCAGAVQWLGAIVADLQKDEIGWGKVKETHGTQLEKGTDNGVTKAAQVNVFVRLWQEERDRLAKVAKTCVDVGIEERRVRLAESAGQQLAAVIRAVLDRLELSDGQRSLAVQVVPDELRRLAGDAVVAGQVVDGGAS
jgi:ribosomal protein L35AE/L33A